MPRQGERRHNRWRAAWRALYRPRLDSSSRWKRMKYWYVLALTAFAAPAFAQEATPAPCPATPAPLPTELAGWTGATPVAAAATAADMGKALIPVSSRADIALLPAAQGQFAVPEKAP